MSLGIDLLALSTAQICLLGVYLFFMGIGIIRVICVLHKYGFFSFVWWLILALVDFTIHGIKCLINSRTTTKKEGKLTWREVL